MSINAEHTTITLKNFRIKANIARKEHFLPMSITEKMSKHGQLT